MGKRIRQAAVIATKNGRVCLITTSSGKRWLVPKGNRQAGCDLRETAVREAWEEAGLVGRVKGEPVGRIFMPFAWPPDGRPRPLTFFANVCRAAFANRSEATCDLSDEPLALREIGM